MGGFTAGLFSIAALLVGGSILATLVKNPQGTTSLVGAVTSGFANDLIAAQGNISQQFTMPSAY